jgi:N-acetylglucosamine kinase-like BadF-type ATPase
VVLAVSWFAGIDGGQSSSELILANGAGTCSVRVKGPPCDLVGEVPGSRRRAVAIDGMLTAAWGEAGQTGAPQVRALVAGLSGHDGYEIEAALPESAIERLRYVHDSEIAHAGALDGEPGILVIAGTGSVALATDSIGRSLRTGGWGATFGDEGSAFWIARRAIARAMHARDLGNFAPRSEDALVRIVREHFGVRSLREIQHRFASGALTRPQIAEFAMALVRLREECEAAAEIVDDAVLRLAELVRISDARLAPERPRTVSYAGGLFAEAAIRERFALALEGADFNVRAPLRTPVEGALLLAYREGAALPGGAGGS